MTATVNPESDQPDQPDETVPAEVGDYVAAVRARLVDLDPEEIDDLTDDLRSHLAEIRADTDEPFDQIIGTPEQFAAELRQSAGLAELSSTDQRWDRWTRPPSALYHNLREAAAPVTGHRWFEATREFIPELRPAWWVARGYLLAGFVGLLTGGSVVTAVVVPSVAGSVLFGFLVTAAFIVASVQFGRRRLSGGWAKVATVATALLAAWIALILFDEAANNYTDHGAEIHPIETYPGGYSVVDGSSPSNDMPANIYAVLPDGTVLDQVLLYDEAGRPLDLPENGYSPALDTEYEAEQSIIANLYPRRLREVDWDAFDGEPLYRNVPPPVIDWDVSLTPGPATTEAPEASVPTSSPTSSPPEAPAETTTTAGDRETTSTEAPDETTDESGS